MIVSRSSSVIHLPSSLHFGAALHQMANTSAEPLDIPYRGMLKEKRSCT